MMYGLSLNFIDGGFSIDSPTALWWKQLATAVVFGLGIATVLTLVFTPAMLALRVWISLGAYASVKQLKALGGRGSQSARDLALRKSASKVRDPILLWSEPDTPDALRDPEVMTPADAKGTTVSPLKAAE